ncbi:amino acid adenylation domain-containing protein [Streptomyces sp. NPDC052396]|uniref:amino acid adenylation domain-containing protein n=1 Tax=Streptomyces sp. NPDC052396 TaxID=3365689 RepID=UPI0037CD40CE
MTEDARRARLSAAQLRLFTEEHLYRTEAAYAVASGLRLAGPVDATALRTALTAVTDRHEPLRTSFELVRGTPCRLIREQAEPELVHLDLSGHPAAKRTRIARDHLAQAQATPFDLTQAPLFRALLLTLGPDEHWLLLTLHHLVTDGWGMSVLWRDLGLAYAAALAGQAPPFTPLEHSYSDHVHRHGEELTGARLERLLTHWRHRLAPPLPRSALPPDRPRPAERTFAGACHSFTLPPHLVHAVRELSARNRTTPFAVLLAAFACLLQRYSGEDEVIVGVPLAGRTRPETLDLVGHLVNPLPLRLRPDPGMTVDQLTTQAHHRTLEAVDHQDLPFDRLVHAVEPHRDRSVHPLFQTLFSVQDIPEAGVDFPGVPSSALPLPPGRTTVLDLSVLFHDLGTGIEGFIEYRRDLFEAATIERLAGNLCTLLAGAARPAATVDGLTIESDQPPPPAAQLDGNPAVVPVHTLVERHADRTPEAIALCPADGERLTYAELDRRANRLARVLAASGVGPERLVGIRLPRGTDLAVAALAVLKAGGAYLPLDPDHPPHRLRRIVADARPCLVLDSLPPSQDQPDERLARPVHPAQLAYVCYTSGSTGRPKGVMVTHAALANFVTGQPMSPRPDDVVGAHFSPAFDASAHELWSTLCAGAQLLTAPGGRLEPQDYRELTRQATALLLTPGLFAVLAEHDQQALARLRHLNLGADQLDPDPVARLRRGPGLTTLNCYGPTECTVAATTGDALRRTPFGRVPIGHPLAGVTVHVLDRRLRPVPPGVPGELYLGGAGLARGYAGAPALTAERFVASPREPGARLYRTGDMVRQLPDGALEMLGRDDDQVKIRGFRVEPAEVEEALRAHPLVRSAVVVARGEADRRELIGYLIPVRRTPDPAATVLDELRKRLPGYLVPSALVVLDAFPLTANGKTDRARLPDPPAAARPAPEQALTPTERLLAEVWAEVLETPDIGPEDDFFEIGGDSLSALRVVAELAEHGLSLALGDLYRLATVRECARELDARPPEGA